MRKLLLRIYNTYHVHKHGYPSRSWMRYLYRQVQHKRLSVYRSTFQVPADFWAPTTTSDIDFVVGLYVAGAELEGIGDCYGKTRERIRQEITMAERTCRIKLKQLN